MNVIMDLLNSLPAVLWVLAGAIIWGCTLATYVVVFEQRRRNRTESTNDDWK